MTIQEIRELLALFNESGVAELEVQRGENRVRFRRASTTEYLVPQPGVAMMPAPAAHNSTASPAASNVSVPPPAADEKQELVTAPIVGTFYECPSPGAPAFVKVGDAVEKGQVLCIIESMKLMNEIEAEVAGTIVSKLVENGKPVEYGQTLFAIRPR